MTRYDGLTDGLTPIDKGDWQPLAPQALAPPVAAPVTRTAPRVPEREPDCEFCGYGPIAGSGCPLHDPFTILLTVFGTIAVAAILFGTVAALMGW